MICRKIFFADQQPQWLLISQVEHARISGLLAEHCLSHLDADLQFELHQAIIHHDDGWAAWEAHPQLDPKGFRPLAFHELPLEESLIIWEASINEALEIGQRAAWVVAKHFLALLEASSKPHTPEVEKWQSQMTARCKKWRGAWRSRSEAAESVRWLQLLDVLSLWLCNVCPGEGEHITQPSTSYRAGAGRPLETEFYFEQGHVRLKPWRLKIASLDLAANGWLIPARKYESTEELMAARVPHEVRWRLVS